MACPPHKELVFDRNGARDLRGWLIVYCTDCGERGVVDPEPTTKYAGPPVTVHKQN
jgi:hypothetical protein